MFETFCSYQVHNGVSARGNRQLLTVYMNTIKSSLSKQIGEA